MGKRQRNEQDDSDRGDDEYSQHRHADSDVRQESQSSIVNDNEVEDTIVVEPEEKKRKKVIRRLKPSATSDFNKRLERRGIVYLSRVPPRMGPAKVKTLLSDFGEVTRVYLVEEDKSSRKRRRKAGGSGSKRYLEGWIEFESKKIAKRVGETLNMSRITNHKGSVNYDDVWNIKYLRGFKWSHLTEKVAYERRVREQKLRVEMMEARRENANYVAQVEAGRKLDYIEERQRKRTDKQGGRRREGDGDGGNGVEDKDGMAKTRRKVRQKRPLEEDGRATKAAILGSLV
jgi:ESF2/ABP1 family protein